jgi:hypothetical protein
LWSLRAVQLHGDVTAVRRQNGSERLASALALSGRVNWAPVPSDVGGAWQPAALTAGAGSTFDSEAEHSQACGDDGHDTQDRQHASEACGIGGLRAAGLDLLVAAAGAGALLCFGHLFLLRATVVPGSRLLIVLAIAFPAQAFATNCVYVIAREGEVPDRRPRIGVEDTVAEVLAQYRLKPAVLLTHGHRPRLCRGSRLRRQHRGLHPR